MGVKEKEKSLIKNTGILAFGTLCAKIFSFFLLPLYTSRLETQDYGNVDVIQTIVTLLVPFASLMLSAASFRFIIEKDSFEDHKVIISTATIVEGIGSGAFVIIYAVTGLVVKTPYLLLSLFYFIGAVGTELVQNIARGFGKNKLYAVMSFSMTVVSVITNLVLILGFGIKGASILVASMLAYYVAMAIAVFSMKLWRYISVRAFSQAKLREMLKYCLPLIPNAISWWIANASDRLLVLFFLGSGANGIYAAANKIPTIYTTIYNVYNIAWIEALSRGANDSDQEVFVNEMFKKSIKFFGCIDIGIICCMSLFFNLLIGKEYDAAYGHIYILMLAIFFNSVCSLYGGVLTAFKESKTIGSTTVFGAVVNFIVNITLIKIIGLYAASISTLVSYVVIFVLRAIKSDKLMKLHWPKSYCIQALAILTLTSVGYFFRVQYFNAGILLIVVIWSVFNNMDLMKSAGGMILNKVRKVS